MAAKHKIVEPDHVDPDLPITPMLDMTFQLLSFFIFTFHPQSAEAQIFIALPEEKGGADKIPDPTSDAPAPVIIYVDVGLGEDASGRRIGPMSIRIEDKTLGVGKKPETMQIRDLKEYQQVLTEKYKQYKDNKGGVKVQLEVEGKLPWQFTVQLVDIAKQAGYTDVAPTIRSVGKK
jgi:biopolymer transport protein ExbD